MENNKKNYYFFEDENFRILFLNTLVNPIKMEPLNHFEEISTEHTEKGYFNRLYKVTYIREKTIKYTIEEWHEIKVKEYCIEGMKALIGLNKAANSYIQY